VTSRLAVLLNNTLGQYIMHVLLFVVEIKLVKLCKSIQVSVFQRFEEPNHLVTTTH
jgi:hypothetical protein